jgi:hypothetical protein
MSLVQAVVPDVAVEVTVGEAVWVMLGVLVTVEVKVSVEPGIVVWVSVGEAVIVEVDVWVGVEVIVNVALGVLRVGLVVTVAVEVMVRVMVKVDVTLGVFVKEPIGTDVKVFVGGKVGLATWRPQPPKKRPVKTGNKQRIHSALNFIALLLERTRFAWKAEAGSFSRRAHCTCDNLRRSPVVLEIKDCLHHPYFGFSVFS